MKPEEMPEFKHLSVRLDKEDWACLRCWKSGSVPYTDVSWALVKSHLKDKCVNQIPSVFVCTLTFDPWDVTRHEVDEPTEDDYYCVRPLLQSDYFLREAATM